MSANIYYALDLRSAVNNHHPLFAVRELQRDNLTILSYRRIFNAPT